MKSGKANRKRTSSSDAFSEVDFSSRDNDALINIVANLFILYFQLADLVLHPFLVYSYLLIRPNGGKFLLGITFRPLASLSRCHTTLFLELCPATAIIDRFPGIY